MIMKLKDHQNANSWQCRYDDSPSISREQLKYGRTIVLLIFFCLCVFVGRVAAKPSEYIKSPCHISASSYHALHPNCDVANSPFSSTERKLGGRRFNVTCEVMQVDMMTKVMDPVTGNISGNGTEPSLEYHCIFRESVGMEAFVLEGLNDESRKALQNATADPSVAHYINIPSAFAEVSNWRGANLWLPSTSETPVTNTDSSQSTNSSNSSNSKNETQFTVLRGPRRFYEPTHANNPKEEASNNNNNPGIIPVDETPNPASHGTKTTLVLRISTTDQIFPTPAVELSRRVFGGADDNVNLAMQYQRCSHGKMNIQMAQGTGIVGGVLDINLNSIARDASASYIVNQASAMAESALGVNLEATFHFVMYCIPPGTVAGGSTGWFAFAYMNWFRSVYNGLACTYVSAQMHEIGHNVGLVHSGQDDDQYGDTSGYMGYGFASHEFPKMCFNPAKSWALGWYQDKQTYVNPAKGQWVGTIMGVDDYSSYDHSVVVRVMTGLNSDLFIGYNIQKGINSETEEFGNLVTVVMETTVLKALGIRQSFVFIEANIIIHVCDKSSPGTDPALGDWVLVSVRSGSETLSCAPVASGISSTTAIPTANPTQEPTPSPTPKLLPGPPAPLSAPQVPPSPNPTTRPSPHPTYRPTPSPTSRPSSQPSSSPSAFPTKQPTSPPTLGSFPSDLLDPIAAYDFNGNAADITGNGMLGTIIGSPLFEEEDDDPSLRLSQTNEHQYVVIGPYPDLQFGNNRDFSVSFWTKPAPTGPLAGFGDPAIISNKNWDAAVNKGWIIGKTNVGYLQCNIADGSNFIIHSTTSFLNDNKWHHIVLTLSRIVFDPFARLYFDGVQIASIDISEIGDVTSGLPIVVGTDGKLGETYPAWYDGNIDGLLIYDNVLDDYDVRMLFAAGKSPLPKEYSEPFATSPSPNPRHPSNTPSAFPTNIPSHLPTTSPSLSPIYGSPVIDDHSFPPSTNPTPNPGLPTDFELIAIYDFEGDTTNTAQLQPFRYQTLASTFGGPQYEEDDGGKYITLIQTDLSRQFVSLASNPFFNFGTSIDFTISLWAKTDFDFRSDPSMYHDPALVSNKSWANIKNKGWIIAATAEGGFQWNIADGSRTAQFASDGGMLNDGEWHHILVSHSRTSFAYIYYDGVQLDKILISDIGDVSSSLSVVVGTDATFGADWPAWFNGSFDRLLLFQGFLSAADANSLYENGRVA